MKAKQGYIAQKHKSNIGNWLKRYFETRTSRKVNIRPEDYRNQNGRYEDEFILDV